MKNFLAPSLAVAAVATGLVPAALAHGQHDYSRAFRPYQARQVPGSSSSSSVPPVSLPAPSGATTSASGVPPVPTATYSFSLAATNPTAVPLASIVANQPSGPLLPLSRTEVPGTVPTFIKGAPGLPDVSKLNPANYPPLDQRPPVDSPEVRLWKQEVANSGITIPDFSPTNPGGCINNTAIASDPARCWWTCTGCTGEKDITQCPNPLSWGLTYDDGPGYYTPNLLAYLDEKQLKSTFFVVGSRSIQFPATLQAQFMAQHQIAVHTWSHPPLTTLSNDEIIAELGWAKKAIKDVLGVTPNMMRPPFGDIDNRVRAISLAMGLVPVIWTRTGPQSTFDTDDFNIHSGFTPVQKVLQNWQTILASASTLDHGFIVLEHDLFEESVEVATGYILPDALAHNPPFKIEPVISCLSFGMSEAYIETNNNKTNPPPNPNIGQTGAKGGNDGNTASAAGSVHSMGSIIASALLVGAAGFAAGLVSTFRV